MNRIKSFTLTLCPLLVLLTAYSYAGNTIPSPVGAVATIISPQDGAVVSSPVKVVFGVKKMVLMPAGTPHTDSGHHHLLIDQNVLPALNKPIPSDKNHVHFGKAQTEATLELSPGKHTLQLMLGDHLHRPHNPPVLSKQITIMVKSPVKKETTKTTK